MDLDGAAAIVFGGASGLGRATAERLVDEGAEVVVADLAEGAGAVAAEIGARSVEVDVTDPAAVERAVAEAGAGLRVSVCCAGVADAARLVGRDGKSSDAAVFAKVIGINLLGTINVLRSAAAAMAGNEPDAGGERGICLQTASIAAYDGQVGQVAYAASKGGVAAATLPAARELAGRGIRVVTIAPGIFETPMVAGLPDPVRDSLAASIPFPSRLGAPSEFAALVAHAIDNPMLNGEVIRLDGSLRMAPR